MFDCVFLLLGIMLPVADKVLQLLCFSSCPSALEGVVSTLPLSYHLPLMGCHPFYLSGPLNNIIKQMKLRGKSNLFKKISHEK